MKKVTTEVAPVSEVKTVGYMCLPKGTTSILAHGMEVQIHGPDPNVVGKIRISCSATRGAVVSVLEHYVSSRRPVVMTRNTMFEQN
ncbi:MAG: hypothetical protein AAB780_02205 [Patescibacteria group bacterium]